MSVRALLGVGLALLLAIVAWWAWPRPSEEERVRELVRSVLDAAERGDAGDVMAPLAEDFVAESDGARASRSTTQALVVSQLMRRGPLHILPGEIAVGITGDTAVVEFDALLAEASPDWTTILPVDGDGWHLALTLRRAEGEWRVVRAVRSDLALPGE